jgi:hypothetical protein
VQVLFPHCWNCLHNRILIMVWRWIHKMHNMILWRIFPWTWVLLQYTKVWVLNTLQILSFSCVLLNANFIDVFSWVNTDFFPILSAICSCKALGYWWCRSPSRVPLGRIFFSLHDLTLWCWQ